MSEHPSIEATSRSVLSWHVLVIESLSEGGWPTVKIECPGLEPGGCRAVWECQVEGCDPDGEGMAHGVEHQAMHFGWGVPSEDCWVQNYDEIQEAVSEAFIDAHRPLRVGRYPFTHDTDESRLTLTLQPSVWEVLATAKVQFWTCIKKEHRFVEWRGDTAHCIEPGCGITSEDTAHRFETFRREIARLTAERDQAITAATEARETAAELQALFDMQWKRSVEASARWRAEAPAERALIMPDLGVLLTWLMDQMDTAQAQRNDAVALLNYAMHLRMHGERAPGGNETWKQFDRDAEKFLRGPAGTAANLAAVARARADRLAGQSDG